MKVLFYFTSDMNTIVQELQEKEYHKNYLQTYLRVGVHDWIFINITDMEYAIEQFNQLLPVPLDTQFYCFMKESNYKYLDHLQLFRKQAKVYTDTGAITVKLLPKLFID